MRIFFYVFVLSISLFAQSSKLGIQVYDPKGNEVIAYQKSYAIVFATGKYIKSWTQLPNARQNAENIKKMLEKHGFHVDVITNPSSQTIRSEMQNFINKFGLSKNNRLLFYYYGHAYGDTNKETNRKMGYLVSSEILHPSKNEKLFFEDAVSLKELQNYAKSIRCNHAIFLFDCQFTDDSLSISNSSEQIPLAINSQVSQPVRHFIVSGINNRAIPNRKLFTQIFIRALSGEGDRNNDGYITGTELEQYVKSKLANHPNKQPLQVGKLFTPNNNVGNFVFVLNNQGSKNVGKALSSKQIFLNNIHINSLEEYRKYIRNFSASINEDVNLPAISFFDNHFFKNMQNITQFHKMELIVYPSNMSYFIKINLNQKNLSKRYVKMKNQSYFRKFSKRGIDLSQKIPQILEIAREVKQSTVYRNRDGQLNFLLLFPRSTAKYLAWKMIVICKKYGYTPKEVLVCNGYFSKTRHGHWSLIISSLMLKSGITVNVEDFEKLW